MSAFTKMWAIMKTFGKWAQKNPTLTAGFGGTGLLIANERNGRWDIKTDIRAELHRELAAFRTCVDGRFTAVDDKLANLRTHVDGRFTAVDNKLASLRTYVDGRFTAVDDKLANLRAYVDGRCTTVDDKLANLHTEHEFTQGLVLRSTIKTMKAIDGNKKELREFVKDAEKLLSCIELGEDCQEVIDDGAGFKLADNSKKPVEK